MGEVVGDGECVAYVRDVTGCPPTRQWAEGVKVRGGDIATGTAIATFQNGTYENISGLSHAAIYISQNNSGITVHDQWRGQVVHTRTISFKGGAGKPSNDGDAFSVIEAKSIMSRLKKQGLSPTSFPKRGARRTTQAAGPAGRNRLQDSVKATRAVVRKTATGNTARIAATPAKSKTNPRRTLNK
jgi:hypothetical protein